MSAGVSGIIGIASEKDVVDSESSGNDQRLLEDFGGVVGKIEGELEAFGSHRLLGGPDWAFVIQVQRT